MNLNDYLTLTRTNQITAAAQIGCSRSLISRWCAGKIKPSRHWWTRIQAWSRGAITADVPKKGTWTATFVSAGKIKPRKRDADDD